MYLVHMLGHHVLIQLCCYGLRPSPPYPRLSLPRHRKRHRPARPKAFVTAAFTDQALRAAPVTICQGPLSSLSDGRAPGRHSPATEPRGRQGAGCGSGRDPRPQGLAFHSTGCPGLDSLGPDPPCPGLRSRTLWILLVLQILAFFILPDLSAAVLVLVFIAVLPVLSAAVLVLVFIVSLIILVLLVILII
ncbi:hypothetical protein NDU88_001055 [Pleurodeles waltl]|uniref:Uncharacterized protein n=1 Tax=Pleurodeles waltl TaxID=8319 RepID=A0AAV7LZE0_PLEWA|nr:hypothetical protein NDU88_001055 [Pleurodeles waltl]